MNCFNFSFYTCWQKVILLCTKTVLHIDVLANVQFKYFIHKFFIIKKSRQDCETSIPISCCYIDLYLLISMLFSILKIQGKIDPFIHSLPLLHMTMNIILKKSKNHITEYITDQPFKKSSPGFKTQTYNQSNIFVQSQHK